MVVVLFLHPDLGIGGAERLVVDAALALKNAGHEVTILTAHHDPTHCFAETTDGRVRVVAAGDWLPRSVAGRCHALCATVRMLYLALYLHFCWTCDVVVVDQVSSPLPLLRFWGFPTLFYCHYPDMLLTSGRTGLKALYRAPMDWLEEVTTGTAKIVLVNSKFTSQVFKNTFQRLPHVNPEVVYPSLNTAQFEGEGSRPASLPNFSPGTTVFLSINRYERKKNLGLAIRSFGRLMMGSQSQPVHLIMAGGYDSRVRENLEHRRELEELVWSLNLGHLVTFLESPPDQEKLWLLKQADCLIYTPTGEHFGIVPVEAMYCRTPVIAVNTGGPTETVVHGETGWLCQPDPLQFAKAMNEAVDGGTELRTKLGLAGRERVEKNFSFSAFSNKWDSFVCKLAKDRLKEMLIQAENQGYSMFSGIAVAFHFVLAMAILFYMVFGTSSVEMGIGKY